DHLCTIDGTKIYERDLSDPGSGLRYKRVMANRYMDLAAVQSINNLRNYVRENAGRASPENKQLFSQAANILNLLDDPQSMSFALQFGGQLLGPVDAITRNPTAKEEDKQLARAVMLTFDLAQRRLMSQGQYFINVPNRNQRDLNEFMLWDKKA